MALSAEASVKEIGEIIKKNYSNLRYVFVCYDENEMTQTGVNERGEMIKLNGAEVLAASNIPPENAILVLTNCLDTMKQM